MQDYASRLSGMSAAPMASPTIGAGSSRALVGGYSRYLPTGTVASAGAGPSYRLGLADNAPLDEEQRNIIETMLSVVNNAPRVR